MLDATWMRLRTTDCYADIAAIETVNDTIDPGAMYTGIAPSEGKVQN